MIDLLGGIPYRLVAIDWVDSYGCASQWGDITRKLPVAHHCFSVGWVAVESDEAIVIVPHLSPENREINSDEHACGDMTIPTCSIISITDLIKKPLQIPTLEEMRDILNAPNK